MPSIGHIAVGAAAGRALSRRQGSRAAAVTLFSAGLLDTLTDGGLGVALLWPFSNRRFFAPWRPIPVAPIGFAMLSARGAFVVAAEAAMFLPFFLYAFWPRRRGGGPSR
ncbi:MAG: metal-dependent hydrolase [Acidobacteria bacterium]|nr:metal-dependent hydrolase [Acidobacteriota bacterium]